MQNETVPARFMATLFSGDVFEIFLPHLDAGIKLGCMPTGKKAVPPNLQKLHCNECHGKTWHKRLKEVHDSGSERVADDYALWWDITHEMFECRGCNSVVMRRTHELSEWDSPDVRFFPPPVSRRKPEWFYEIPNEIRLLLEETYNSLDANSTSLPLMGARALLDMLIVDKVGDAGTFTEKMKTLENKGFISAKNREILEVALDAGNAAAHRGYRAKHQDVQAVMDIVENLLQATYVLGDVAAELKKSTPPRPGKKKAP
jgi:hypothetical protein